MSTGNANKVLCKYCGKPEHGSSMCDFSHLDLCWSEEWMRTIEKQQEIIDRLKKENEKLRGEIEVWAEVLTVLHETTPLVSGLTSNE